VQMPDTRKQASHLLMTEAALACGFGAEIADVRIPRVENDADFYANALLTANSPVLTLDMWTTTYYQFLEGEDPVPKFTKSTGLMPYLEALGGEKSAKGSKFMKEYISSCAKAYPRRQDGKTLFPFTRFFFGCFSQAGCQAVVSHKLLDIVKKDADQYSAESLSLGAACAKDFTSGSFGLLSIG